MNGYNRFLLLVLGLCIFGSLCVGVATANDDVLFINTILQSAPILTDDLESISDSASTYDFDSLQSAGLDLSRHSLKYSNKIEPMVVSSKLQNIKSTYLEALDHFSNAGINFNNAIEEANNGNANRAITILNKGTSEMITGAGLVSQCTGMAKQLAS